VRLLVYSNRPTTRERVHQLVGRHPAAELDVEFVDADTGLLALQLCEQGDVDLAVLDGEAAPTGGMGLCRQLKDELAAPPPVLLLVGRRDDAWLATWSRAERTVLYPLDALRLVQAVTELLLPAARSA
jgi:CheY-like chemotaxis protein